MVKGQGQTKKRTEKPNHTDNCALELALFQSLLHSHTENLAFSFLLIIFFTYVLICQPCAFHR